MPKADEDTLGKLKAVAAEVTLDPIEEQKRRIEAQRDVQKNAALIKQLAREDALRDYLAELVSQTAQRFKAPPAYRPPKIHKDASVETMYQAFSDWHAYEEVDADRTLGFNEYDALIMGQRVRRIVESHISIKRRMERGGGWHFPKLIIGANGDFVSGTIHEIEKHTDAPNIVMAVYGCGLVLGQAIRDLAAEYERVEIFCTAGNHGRLPDARKKQHKDPTRTWDTLIYLYAMEHLRDVPNVQFYIPNAFSVAIHESGWEMMQTHGDDVKSWNAIPWYGLNRKVSKMNALEASRRRIINYWIFGHFHTDAELQTPAGASFINGSLIGGNEYSIGELSEHNPPTQLMFGIHPAHGVTFRYPLLGDTDKNAPAYAVKPWEDLFDVTKD